MGLFVCLLVGVFLGCWYKRRFELLPLSVRYAFGCNFLIWGVGNQPLKVVCGVGLRARVAVCVVCVAFWVVGVAFVADWVAGDGLVAGRAFVGVDSKVSGRSLVSDCAQVIDGVVVQDSRVADFAQVVGVVRDSVKLEYRSGEVSTGVFWVFVCFGLGACV